MLEVHVQDVDAAMLLSGSEVASVMSARIEFALKTWFLLPINERRSKRMQNRVCWHGWVPEGIWCWQVVVAGEKLVGMGCKAQGVRPEL